MAEELQKIREEKETLERQIDFHRKWIVPKVRPGAESESEKRFLASLESDHSEVVRKTTNLEKRLRAERSKEFDFGWEKKETDELPGRTSGGLSAQSSEMKALRIIAEEGGDTNFGVVSRKMGVEYAYARLLCMCLARADYIDIPPGGRCTMTPRGEKELEKKGLASWL